MMDTALNSRPGHMLFSSREILFWVLWLLAPVVIAASYPWLNQDPERLKWTGTALMILVLFFSVVVHEICHGLAAYYSGDDTAKAAGRLTMNPISHVSVVGTIIVPTALYLLSPNLVLGWAKPVPFKAVNLRTFPRDQILLTIAGPFSNLVLAYFSFFLYLGVILVHNGLFPENPASFRLDFFSPIMPTGSSWPGLWFVLFNGLSAGLAINLTLAVFNMLPIPPLDGGWILKALLPLKVRQVFSKFHWAGLILVILMIQFGWIMVLFYPLLILLGLAQVLATFILSGI